MEFITSKSNEKVKYIKNLNEKKFREKYNAFYLEGIKVVNEILDRKEAVNILFIAYSNEILSTKNDGKKLIKRLEAEKIEKVEFSKKIFEYVTDTVTTQGVIVVLEIKKYKLQDLIDGKSSIVLLDKIQDLGNIGTIIRNTSAFLINNIICIKGTADVYSNKVTRSTMGTIINKKIVYIEKEELISNLNYIKDMGYNVITTSLDTNNYIEDVSFKGNNIYVMGNEANGVSKEIQDISNLKVKIDMSDNVESLNVSVANGIILYKHYIDNK